MKKKSRLKEGSDSSTPPVGGEKPTSGGLTSRPESDLSQLLPVKPEVVRVLLEMMRGGTRYDEYPIVVGKKAATYRIVDGHNRFKAAIKAQESHDRV